MKLKYYKELDGVRGLAALMIMFFHFMQGEHFTNVNGYHLVHKTAKFGQTGVTLFFALSGFLITRILLSSKASENYFSSFYSRRALRIFPLYYLFLILTYFIIPLIAHQAIVGFKDTWTYWFYLQNFAITFNYPNIGFNHLWSLAVEEHFYLFWPVIVYYCSTKRLTQVIAGIVVLSVLCRIYLIYLGYGTFYFTFTTFDCLAIGALLAINETKNWFTYKRLLQVGGALFVLLVIVWSVVSNESNKLVQYLKLPITSLFYLCFLGIITLKATKLSEVFKNSFFTYTGKISYGLYIYHPLCFYYSYNYLFHYNIYLSLPISFAISYLVASISYYGFEYQFIKLKKYFKTFKKGSTIVTDIST